MFIFVLPAMIPWMPHGVTHALHDQHISHHQQENSGHTHGSDHVHNHDSHSLETVQHPAHFDVVTYYSDYLHVDLKNPQQSSFNAPALDIFKFDYTSGTDISPQPRYELAMVQSRAPPDDWRQFRSDAKPLYLSTQRLRI